MLVGRHSQRLAEEVEERGLARVFGTDDKDTWINSQHVGFYQSSLI